MHYSADKDFWDQSLWILGSITPITCQDTEFRGHNSDFQKIDFLKIRNASRFSSDTTAVLLFKSFFDFFDLMMFLSRPYGFLAKGLELTLYKTSSSDKPS